MSETTNRAFEFLVNILFEELEEDSIQFIEKGDQISQNNLEWQINRLAELVKNYKIIEGEFE
jgi:hypothetical protein